MRIASRAVVLYWANYNKTEAEKKRGRTPTYDEVRSMAWQCICEGATGLVNRLHL